MSKLKSFDEFVNENLVSKGEYNFYGPGSLKPLVQKLVSEGKNESIIRTYLTSIGVVPWRIDKVMQEMAETITIEKKINEGKKMTFEENATKFLSDINEEEEELDEAAINEFDMPGFWEFFSGGAGWEAGKIAVWMGLALSMVVLAGVAATGVSLIAKAKSLYHDYKDKKGAKEALDFMQKSPKVKELIQFSKDLIKQRKKTVDKRRKNSDEDIKAIKRVEKQMVKQRQQIGKDLIEEMKKAKLSTEALDYLAWNVPYVKTALRMNRLGESVNEVSRWKGKEIFPNWVKPSDIQGFVKSIRDLVDGRDYVIYEPGMDSWQAEYEYVGRDQGDYVFRSSSQFSTSPDERFSGKELAGMIKDLELAIMEGKEINEKALINKKPKRSIRPHGKVKPGNVAIDYNDEPYTVVGVGTVADLAQFDDSGAAEELDPSEDAIALLGRGGYAVYSYDPDGAVVYEGEIYDQLNEFMVKPLKHDEFDWEFEIADPSDKKLYKALTDAGIEFGTNNGKLTIMGAGKMDKAVPAIKILHKFGIKEGVNEAKKKTFEDATAAFLLGLQGSDVVNDDKNLDEKLNKKTLQVEGDGEDVDDMIDDLADGDEDETQGPDDSAPDGEDSPEAKIKDGESPEDAVEGDNDASSKIASATKELEKDSKKLAKLKKILLDESATNEEITRALNDGAMSELHLLAKEAKDEKDFLSKAKDFVKDQGAKFDGLEKMFKEFYSDMKNESVKETKEVTIDDDGKEVEDEENITDTKTGDEIQVEEPQEESTSNAYMDAVTEGLKHRFNK